MKCLECDGEYRIITSSHLFRCCGMTVNEYSIKHNNPKLVDDAFVRYGDQNPNWRGGRSQRGRCEICAKELSLHPEVRRCSACRQVGRDNPFLGKTHSEETKLKMRHSASLRDKASYSGFPVADFKTLSDRSKAFWAKIPKEDRAGRIPYFVKAGHHHCRKNKNTSIERAVEQHLVDLQICFQKNVPVGRFFVDFISDNIIVECYGDYWHANPDKYPADYEHRCLKMTASEKWLKDAERVKFFTDMGYQVLILWESEIKSNPIKTKDDLAKVFALMDE